MATEIGTVTVLIGTATAVSTDGSIRHLQVGDKVFQNDLISTGADGALEIHFADGSVMDLGRTSNALLDSEVFDPTAPLADAQDEALADEIDLIQQAILEGADPTQIAEATAAGAGPEAGSEGTREPFYNQFNAPETRPDHGFDTTGISVNFFDPEPISGLLSDGDDAVFPPIESANLPPLVLTGERLPPSGDNQIVARALVNEAGLPHGTNPSSGSASFSGNFFIDDPDGLSDIVNLSINGNVIPIDQLADGSDINVIGTSLGVITITSYDNLTGEVQYHFELSSSITHEKPDNDELVEAAETIIVTVTDTAGQTGSGVLVIDVQDDVPEVSVEAVDLGELVFVTQDSETIEGGTSVATGSVAAALLSAVTVTYGADGEGDTVIAGYELILNESLAHDLTSGGEAVVFSLDDGAVIGVANGTEVIRIEIADDGEVTVTQSAPLDHPLAGIDSLTLPAGLVGVSATVTVTDGDGDEVSETIAADLSGVISVVDDVPVAEDDTNELSQNETEVSGNVLDNDNLGADGGAVIGVRAGAEVGSIGTALQGAFGTLVLNNDGSYVYTLTTDMSYLPDGVIETDVFTYTIADGDGDTDQAILTIFINGLNDIPETLSSYVITCEDTLLTFQLGDFRYTDADGDALQFVRIDSLPLDGQLLFDGVAVTEAGLEISVEDIENGLLTFMPNPNESGRDEYADDTETGNMRSDYASFEFSVSDGTDWSSSSGTMTIDVTPVADAPLLSVSSKETRTVTINKDNVTDTSGTYTVLAFAAGVDPDAPGATPVDISIRGGTFAPGFGVSGATFGGANQGHPDELGFDFNLDASEHLVVKFENDVTTVDVSFAWKHGYNYNSVTGSGAIEGETAVISFYMDGVFIESLEHAGGTDRVDGPYTFQPSSGVAFNEIRFSAKGEGDDYLINSITYTELVDSVGEITVEAGDSILLSISAALTDTDGSESITKIVVSNIPSGFVLTDGTHTFTATDDLNEIDVKDWDLSSLSLQVPPNAVYETTEFQLTVSATSEESLAGTLDPSEVCGSLTATTEVPLNVTVTALPPVLLEGTRGADILIGTEANEIIYGGAGNDVMTGGGGRDVFVWKSGDASVFRPASDTITDFNNGQADVLDISDLLQGEEAGNLTDYIRIEQVGDDVVLNLSPNGDGAEFQTITLQGTSLGDLGVGHYDPNTQQAEIINSLVSQGQIQVDQS
ncbi:MAG: retention module-containing protein [Methylophaga sp.]|nr:retention module-containing protein [Methylophaga sp.]